ncbi:transposase [Streptococcus pneumoniae]|nr:transposase [Streptococcus pneumoniae]
MLDATEVQINRPKKKQLANYSGKKMPRYEVVQNESQKYRTSW